MWPGAVLAGGPGGPGPTQKFQKEKRSFRKKTTVYNAIHFKCFQLFLNNYNEH